MQKYPAYNKIKSQCLASNLNLQAYKATEKYDP